MRPSPRRLMDLREYPILYVDDEPENLRIFELGFRRDYEILTATSAEVGLRMLNENPVALVLSDHRMPGMTGVEFLERVRQLDPKTIRVLVTAYGDSETLGSAINKGSIYKYVPKPWNPEDMDLTLRRGIEVYALDREREALLRELTTLTRLSAAINQELELEPLLDMLLRMLVQELHYDGAALLFLDAEQGQLTWARALPDDDVARRLRQLPLDRTHAPRLLAKLTAAEAQVLRFENASELEAPVRSWVTEVSADELLLVPLVGKRQVIGAIAVDNRRGGHGFEADDRVLLEGVATHAVIAIENARLVDDLRRSREQVLRADRLGTLGTLAAGLAHEINNPLVSIRTFLELAPEKRSEDDPSFWGEYHRLTAREVDRIRELVTRMAHLAKGGHGDAEAAPVDLGRLVAEVSTLLEREARQAKVRLAVDADPGLPSVMGVRDHLHQVVMNLLLNAIQASPAGSEVRVRVGRDAEHPDQSVWMSVEDHGSGIHDAELERIFDPFFTTKDPSLGTGLGLMICHRIVSDHGGTIEVRSRQGEGSVFRVRLRVKGPDPPSALPSPA
jgi:two-component system, NtrC family, sensor kinase